MSKKPDRNRLCVRDVEFRAIDPVEPVEGSGGEPAGDGRTMEGYAAVFDAPTEINSFEGHFTESISRGAFTKTLAEHKPVLQFDHGHDSRVGSIPIGAFTELREDDQGLYCQARLFDNPVVEPVRQAIEGGAISGMSFRFRVNRDEWRDKSGTLVRGDELGRLLYEPGDRGPLQRNIKEVQLFEAGPVVYPAYGQTSVSVRSLSDEERETLVAEYVRTAVQPEEAPAVEEETSVEDAARSGTSDAGITPEDAALSGTSSGIEREIVKPAEKAASEPMIRKAVPRVKTLEELRAALAGIAEQMSTMGEESRDAELSPEKQTEWDGLEAEYAATERSIKAIEDRSERLKAFAVNTPKAVDRGDTRQAPAFHRKAENIHDLNELRSSSASEEDFHDKLRDNAMRFVEGARFASTINRESAQSHMEMLINDHDTERGDLARRFLVTGDPAYERAFGKAVKAGTTAYLSREEHAALVERAQTLGTDSSGGFAVPVQLDPTVMLTNAGVVNPIREIARVEPIVGKEWQGVTSAGVTVSRAAEAAEAADNSFALAQPVVRTNRVQGFVPFTIESEVSWGALRSEITRLLVDAKATEEDSFITGDGSTGQQPGGIIGSLSGNTVTAGGTAAFAAADIYNLQTALSPRWERNSRFLAHKAIYNKVRQFDTAGGAQLWSRIGDGTPNTLMSYPAASVSAMDNVLTTGKKILLYGDFSNFLIVDRIGMNVELVPQVFGASGRPTGQRGIYAIWMNNSKILVPSAFKVLVTG